MPSPETRTRRSFQIALWSASFLIVGIVLPFFLNFSGLFPLSWETLLETLFMVIGISLIGFGMSWIAKKIEKIERNW